LECTSTPLSCSSFLSFFFFLPLLLLPLFFLTLVLHITLFCSSSSFLLSQTCLHYAVRDGRKDVVTILLEFGGDPRIKGDGGSCYDIVRAAKLVDILYLLDSFSSSSSSSLFASPDLTEASGGDVSQTYCIISFYLAVVFSFLLSLFPFSLLDSPFLEPLSQPYLLLTNALLSQPLRSPSRTSNLNVRVVVSSIREVDGSTATALLEGINECKLSLSLSPSLSPFFFFSFFFFSFLSSRSSPYIPFLQPILVL
jgi:hypothetical protein